MRELKKGEVLLSEAEAATIMKVSRHTLRNWRSRGGGPPHVKVGGKAIRYRLEDINKFLFFDSK